MKKIFIFLLMFLAIFKNFAQTVYPLTPSINNSVVGLNGGISRFASTHIVNLFSVTSTSTANFNTLAPIGNIVQLGGSSNNGDFTISGNTIIIPTTGNYTIVGNVSINTSGAFAHWGQIVKNNSTVITSAASQSQGTNSGAQVILNYYGAFNAGDIIDIRISSNVSGSIGISGYSINVEQKTGFATSTGTSVDFLNAAKNSSQNVTAPVDVTLNTESGNILFDGTNATLVAGKTYTVSYGIVASSSPIANGYAVVSFVNASNNIVNNNKVIVLPSTWNQNGGASPCSATLTFTPTVTGQYKLRVSSISATSVTLEGSTADWGRTWLNIVQVGSSATTGLNLNLTTTGTGPSTYNSATSTLNVPQTDPISKTKALLQGFGVGNNTLLHGMNLSSPFYVEVFLRDLSNGSVIPCNIVSVNNTAITINSTAAVTSGRLSIIEIKP